MKIHPFHTRTKGEDSEVRSRMWQHSYCKTLQQRISHPWRKHSETVQEAVWSRAQKNWSWTRDFSPAKEEARQTTHSWWARWKSSEQYVRSLRRAGTPVNARIVIATAEGIIKATDRTMLIENGGHIQLTLAWAYSLLQRMGFVQRKATTKTKTSLWKSELELAKKSYLKRIKKAVADAKIPAELVINWDQTGVNVVPASQWTQEEKGSSRVEVAGVGDKRQIMVTVAGTLSGKLLPFQVLYEGKTERCHPSTAFPEGFDIWHTPNHWANGETSIRM